LIVDITPGKPNNVHLTVLKGKFTQKLGYSLGYPIMTLFLLWNTTDSFSKNILVTLPKNEEKKI